MMGPHSASVPNTSTGPFGFATAAHADIDRRARNLTVLIFVIAFGALCAGAAIATGIIALALKGIL